MGDSFGSDVGSEGALFLGFFCAGDSFGSRSRLTVAWPTPTTLAIARWLASMAAENRSTGFLAPVQGIVTSHAQRSTVRRRIEPARRPRDDVVTFELCLPAAPLAAPAVTSQNVSPQLSPAPPVGFYSHVTSPLRSEENSSPTPVSGIAAVGQMRHPPKKSPMKLRLPIR